MGCGVEDSAPFSARTSVHRPDSRVHRSALAARARRVL